jgi:hypothetical protein
LHTGVRSPEEQEAFLQQVGSVWGIAINFEQFFSAAGCCESG